MKHIARKRFGQNFLTNQQILHEIIQAIQPQKEDCMVEIGPGLGAMTNLILERVAKLNVVEIDRDLVARFQKTHDPNRLIIHQADALSFDFSTLIPSDKKCRVVGNLPYNISTPLLFHLSQFADLVYDQHFMLQKEVVERMVAEPGSKDYGRLTVMLQWMYYMELLFIVPPDAFDPPPKVDSAIVRMIPKPQRLDCDAALLEKVVTQAFSQRRKVIRNGLSPLFAENELIDAGIDPSLRPENIALECYVNLARQLKSKSVNPIKNT